MILDDRGHMLVAMSSYPDGCYDIGPERIKKYRNLQAMLVGAVEGGARRFQPESSIQGCIVQDGGKIWFSYQGHGAVHYYDGERWDTLQLREPVYYLTASREHGVVIRTQRKTFFTYVRGQIQQLPISVEERGPWFLGPLRSAALRRAADRTATRGPAPGRARRGRQAAPARGEPGRPLGRPVRALRARH